MGIGTLSVAYPKNRTFTDLNDQLGELKLRFEVHGEAVHVHNDIDIAGGNSVTENFAGRELLSDGALGPKTSLHISSVQEISLAPNYEDACIVKCFSDERKFMVGESATDVTYQQTAFFDRIDAKMEARFGRQWTRF